MSQPPRPDLDARPTGVGTWTAFAALFFAAVLVLALQGRLMTLAAAALAGLAAIMAMGALLEHRGVLARMRWQSARRRTQINQAKDRVTWRGAYLTSVFALAFAVLGFLGFWLGWTSEHSAPLWLLLLLAVLGCAALWAGLTGLCTYELRFDEEFAYLSRTPIALQRGRTRFFRAGLQSVRVSTDGDRKALSHVLVIPGVPRTDVARLDSYEQAKVLEELVLQASRATSSELGEPTESAR